MNLGSLALITDSPFREKQAKVTDENVSAMAPNRESKRFGKMEKTITSFFFFQKICKEKNVIQLNIDSHKIFH